MRNGDVKVVGRTERGSLAVEIGGQKVVEIDSREVDGWFVERKLKVLWA
jgi:hypothetical protein